MGCLDRQGTVVGEERARQRVGHWCHQRSEKSSDERVRPKQKFKFDFLLQFCPEFDLGQSGPSQI
jgi:hypothetical protein